MKNLTLLLFAFSSLFNAHASKSNLTIIPADQSSPSLSVTCDKESIAIENLKSFLDQNLASKSGRSETIFSDKKIKAVSHSIHESGAVEISLTFDSSRLKKTNDRIKPVLNNSKFTLMKSAPCFIAEF